MGSDVLFISKNLIGDALNIYPALRRFCLLNPYARVTLFTLPDATSELYRHMGLPIQVVTSYEELGFDPEKTDIADTGFDMIHNFNVSQAFAIGDQYKVHIAAAYAMALRVRLEQDDVDLVYNPPMPQLEEREKGLFLLSPFSKSCSSNQGQKPNKMIPFQKWQPIIAVIKAMGGHIGVLGSKYDRAPELLLAEDEYFTGLSFPKVAAMMRAARMLITIDNGLAHLGASQKVNEILFYPACLGTHWIVPIGNPNLLQVIQLDPAEIDVSLLVLAVKRKIKEKNLHLA